MGVQSPPSVRDAAKCFTRADALSKSKADAQPLLSRCALPLLGGQASLWLASSSCARSLGRCKMLLLLGRCLFQRCLEDVGVLNGWAIRALRALATPTPCPKFPTQMLHTHLTISPIQIRDAILAVTPACCDDRNLTGKTHQAQFNANAEQYSV